MVCKACVTPIAHGVGSYKKDMSCVFLKAIAHGVGSYKRDMLCVFLKWEPTPWAMGVEHGLCIMGRLNPLHMAQRPLKKRLPLNSQPETSE